MRGRIKNNPSAIAAQNGDAWNANIKLNAA